MPTEVMSVSSEAGTNIASSTLGRITTGIHEPIKAIATDITAKSCNGAEEAAWAKSRAAFPFRRSYSGARVS